MKYLIVTTALLLSQAAFATEKDHQDALAIDADCKADAQTAQCGNEIVGKGLLRCLHQYKHNQRKTNPNFAYSPKCESDLQQLKSDKKAGI